MKDHAPWRDRTPERKKYARNIYDREHHARAGLNVTIQRDRSEEERYNVGYARAKQEDVNLLGYINANRKREWLQQQKDLVGKIEKKYGTMAGAPSKVLQKFNKRKLDDVLFNKVPANVSNVAKFDAEFEKARIPVATLEFSQDKRLSYSRMLETSMGGRYSIIAPAIAYWYPKTMARIKSNLNLVQNKNASWRGAVARIERNLFDDQVGQFEQYVASETQAEGTPYRTYGEARKKKKKSNQRTYRRHGRAPQLSG